MVEDYKKKGGQIIGEMKNNEDSEDMHENSDDEKEKDDSASDSDSGVENERSNIKKVVGGKRKNDFEIVAEDGGMQVHLFLYNYSKV